MCIQKGILNCTQDCHEASRKTFMSANVKEFEKQVQTPRHVLQKQKGDIFKKKNYHLLHAGRFIGEVPKNQFNKNNNYE